MYVLFGSSQNDEKTGSIFMLPLRKLDDERLQLCETHNGMMVTTIMFIFIKWLMSDIVRSLFQA